MLHLTKMHTAMAIFIFRETVLISTVKQRTQEAVFGIEEKVLEMFGV